MSLTSVGKFSIPWHTEIARDKAAVDRLNHEFETSAHHFNLDEFCLNGGSTGEISIESVEIEPFDEDDEEICGSFSISFQESYYNGCKDQDWHEDFSGDGTFAISRETGECKVSIEAAAVGDKTKELNDEELEERIEEALKRDAAEPEIDRDEER